MRQETFKHRHSEWWVLAQMALKARREEQRLCLSHPDYAAYRQRTPAIIPHLPGLDWRTHRE